MINWLCDYKFQKVHRILYEHQKSMGKSMIKDHVIELIGNVESTGEGHAPCTSPCIIELDSSRWINICRPKKKSANILGGGKGFHFSNEPNKWSPTTLTYIIKRLGYLAFLEEAVGIWDSFHTFLLLELASVTSSLNSINVARISSCVY